MAARVNFHQLFLFYTVARAGGFSKAAQELGVSQPAVSVQLRELEHALGTRLLQRQRRRVQLTDAGQVVYSHAQRIFALAQEMQEALDDLKGLRTGRLTLGASTTPGEYLLPKAIGEFKARYPKVEIALTIANSQAIIQRLERRELDIGMVGTEVRPKELAAVPYVQDNILIIASPHHPLARKKRLTLGDIRGQPFVFREPGSATRGTAEEALKALGVKVQVALELGSNEAVKRAVAAGLGLGVISGFGVEAEKKAGLLRVLRVAGWRCRRTITLLYRKDQHLTAAQKAFLEMMGKEKPVPEPPG